MYLENLVSTKSAPARRRRASWRQWGPGLLLISPSILLVGVFVYGMIGININTSLLDMHTAGQVSGRRGTTVVGLSNFTTLFGNPDFRHSFINLILFTVTFLAGTLVVGFLWAWLLDRPIKGEGIFRSIFLFPMAVSFVASGVVWRWLLNSAQGESASGLNRLFEMTGLRFLENSWTQNTTWGILAIALPAVWQLAGYVMALFLAGFRGIPDDLREAVYRLSHQAIDGLVVVQAGRAGREQLALPPSMPVAVSDSTLVDYYPSASADQVGGVREAVTHLLELGHRTVHHVCGPEDSQSALIRKATWARTLREAGRNVPEAVTGDWEAAAGYEAGLRLAADPEVTAVFCANDELALGLIRAMHEQGRRVPQDVSVVGFDGLAVGEYSFPPLTTVRQPVESICRAAVSTLLAQLNGQRPADTEMLFAPDLIVRDSTAAAPID